MTDLPESRDLRGAPPEELDELAQNLYRTLGPTVLQLGHRFFNARRDQAEDLVAETFAQVIRSLPHFQGRSSYKTWVFRIAMNVASDLTRNVMRHRREGHALETNTVREPRPGALQNLLDRERDELIRRSVESLNLDHRMILSLVAVDGISRGEAADLLGIEEGTVWSRYARARIALARAFAKNGIGNSGDERAAVQRKPIAPNRGQDPQIPPSESKPRR